MIYLAIRTDKPKSEIDIFQDTTPLSHHAWLANRKLAETINSVVEEQLTKQGFEYKDLSGIVFYKGPGSFTGLRIGASVANALASSLKINIIAASGTDWILNGINQIQKGNDDKIAVPEYGALPNVTKQKK